MTLGQLISFLTLSGFFLTPLFRLLTMQPYWQEVAVSLHRLLDVFETEEEPQSEQPITPEYILGDIVFDNVSFAYGTRENAISDISFRIKKGQTVAFVGTSGSGKTTLLKLLMRFYPCAQGKITVGDTDISQLEIESYRKKIGYVPQECLLFSGTILENIAWGEDTASDMQIVAAAKLSQADAFIKKLPDRYNTVVGEHGATLSGGERQRIALARALLRNPDFLVLDEATASLDSVSEKLIMNSVYHSKFERTTIIVAHRLSTVKKCDCIFVFDKGHVVESGTHNQLIRLNGVYKSLWNAQNEE